MRPLLSSTPRSSVRPSSPLFDEIRGGDHDSDDATLLSPLLARTLAQRDIPALVNAPLAVFGSAAAVGRAYDTSP